MVLTELPRLRSELLEGRGKGGRDRLLNTAVSESCLLCEVAPRSLTQTLSQALPTGPAGGAPLRRSGEAWSLRERAGPGFPWPLPTQP